MYKTYFTRWRANFVTGLAVLLPAIASVVLVVWFFSQVASITDTLLFFLPTQWTHKNSGLGPVYWHWSLAALVLAVLLISLVGRMTRYYVGVKMVEMLDQGLLRVPLLNKIYLTIKQVNDAFTSNKTSFKQVVLVDFPQPGQRMVGFVTGDHDPAPASGRSKVVSVFIPTTPNPTSGFLVLVAESEVTKLDLSVAEGIKYIVSLGAIPPETLSQRAALPSHG